MTEEELEDTGEILVVHRDDRRTWPLVISVGTSVGSAILAAALCLTVQNQSADRARQNAERLEQVQRKQSADLCAVITALDDNYREFPSSTVLGRENARTLAGLRANPDQACPAPTPTPTR